MVLELEQKKENNTGIFSIERFESERNLSGVSWPEINEQLEYDVESMFKNTHRPPMLNIVNKACNIIGLKNADYVMMKNNKPEYCTSMVYNSITRDRVSTDIIDADILELYVKESGWSYVALASLMSKRTIFYNGKAFLNSLQKSIEKSDLDNLCWALKHKCSAICNISTTANEEIPKRVLNDRQVYLLNPNTIKDLSENIDKICKYAHVPKWFICNTENVYVSFEMLHILCNAVKRATGKAMLHKDLCLNYDMIDRKVQNKKCKKNKLNKKENKKEKKVVKIPNEIKETIVTSENQKPVKESRANKTMCTNNEHYPKNYDRKETRSFMEDILYKIDRLTDSELANVEKYIRKSKELREFKNSLLE